MRVVRQQRRLTSTRVVPLRWRVLGAVILVVAIAATVTVLLLERGREEGQGPLFQTTASDTLVTSPYDLSELPPDTDLERVEEAALVSVFVPDENGTLTSYGMRADLSAARALIMAVRDAEEIDPDVAAAQLSGKAPESRLTFVFPSRETLTFALYLDQGLIARDTGVWRPKGDLQTLVRAATAGPG